MPAPWFIWLAGRAEKETNWRQAGVKAFIYVGCDVLSALQAGYNALGNQQD